MTAMPCHVKCDPFTGATYDYIITNTIIDSSYNTTSNVNSYVLHNTDVNLCQQVLRQRQDKDVSLSHTV